MLNRILIRIKVVQMLYAYLLTRTEFKIDTNPDLSSADKRFAYSTYVDMLFVLLEMTGHNTDSLAKPSVLAVNKKLAASAVGNALAADSSIKDFIRKGSNSFIAIQPILQRLHDDIVKTSVFEEYNRKDSQNLENEINLWLILIESVIAKDNELIAILRQQPGFSNVGLQMALEMIADTLRSYFTARHGYFTALKNLETSLEKAHALYISVFSLIVNLTLHRERQIDNAKAKFLATDEEKNPNTRFINNRFAECLATNNQLADLVKQYGIDWTEDIILLNSLLQSIEQSPIYKEYMDDKDSNWEKDCEFWRNILRNVIFTSDDFIEAVENESVYWNDDLHIIGTFALKSIRIDAQEKPGHIEFLPRFKDDEDSRFGAELFEFAIKNRDLYNSYIEMFIDSNNWDAERIAFMDFVIMICAVAEIVNFPLIPLAVSMNEYVDIANYYSTTKSGPFINGMLFNIVEKLKADGIIVKS